MGNVSSILQLLLQTLESQLMALKRVVRGIILTLRKGSTCWRHHVVQQKEDNVALLKKQSEIQKVTPILTVALDLCEKNSGSKSNQKELGCFGSIGEWDVLSRRIDCSQKMNTMVGLAKDRFKMNVNTLWNLIFCNKKS